jgi:hypothetical protein
MVMPILNFMQDGDLSYPTVNNPHKRLKDWMERFQDIATNLFR